MSPEIQKHLPDLVSNHQKVLLFFIPKLFFIVKFCFPKKIKLETEFILLIKVFLTFNVHCTVYTLNTPVQDMISRSPTYQCTWFTTSYYQGYYCTINNVRGLIQYMITWVSPVQCTMYII